MCICSHRYVPADPSMSQNRLAPSVTHCPQQDCQCTDLPLFAAIVNGTLPASRYEIRQVVLIVQGINDLDTPN